MCSSIIGQKKSSYSGSRISGTKKERNEMKRSKPKSRSSERAKEERQYLKLLKPWMEEHPWCEACSTVSWQMALSAPGCYIPLTRKNPTSECHHKAGRNSRLLLLQEYWLPVCSSCHSWITAHGKIAREIGLSIDLPVELGLKTR